MRLVLYGGTFDPIHHGHLILARDALERLEADRVLFLPAALSPHKLGCVPGATAVRRREMLTAAIADEPRFLLDDRELHRAGPSFTYDTVAELHAEQPHAELLYLVGEDNVRALHTWHRIRELQALAQFIIVGRTGLETAAAHPALPRRLDLSSTEIRERIAQGRSIRYLVPEPVRALIEQHQLYRQPLA